MQAIASFLEQFGIEWQVALAQAVGFVILFAIVRQFLFRPIGEIMRQREEKIVNQLATSYKNVSPNKWRFELRKGVTFHNGERFNAASVKGTFEKIYAPASKSPQKGWFGTIDRIDVVNDYAVDIVTKSPYAGSVSIAKTSVASSTRS